jgi:hypothetical protein
MKSRRLLVGTLVRVRWSDAWFEFEHDGDAFADVYKVDTVGIVVNVGSVYLSLASERLANGDGYRSVTHIPHRIVEGVTVLCPSTS